MITKLISSGIALAACTYGYAAADVMISQKGKNLVVKNKFYKVEFKANKGYMMSVLSPGKKRCAINGFFVFSTDGEQKKYIKRYASAPRKIRQSQMAATSTILKNDSGAAVVKLNLDFIGCKAVDTMTFTAGSPLIKHDVQLSFNKIMFEANYQLEGIQFSSGHGESIFYPDNKRVKGIWISGFNSFCPTWKYAWNPKIKAGFGLIGPAGSDWNSIHYLMRGKKEGWGTDLTLMQLMHKPLRYINLPGKVNFTFYVIAGGNPGLCTKMATALLPEPKEIKLEKVWPQKLVTHNNKDNYTTIAVSNNGKEVQKVKLISKAVWSLANNKLIDNREITLKPGQSHEFKVHWKANPMDWGMTFRTDAYVNDKLVDSMEEYCAVSDFAPAVAGVGIYNVGNCRQEGSEAVWVEKLRKGYIGVVEYYCWAPSTIGDLAPKEDKWEPHTESQGSYRTTVTKKFLKTFISDAHKNGIYVYAWITGLFNFQKGLEDPSLFQYCANGQPNLYNGKIHGDKRFTVGKGNMFAEDTAYKWGQEMGRSVDMFGWDGCRWDWAFIPNAPCDPLYQDKIGAKDQPDWYNWKGVPSKKLYPAPDATAAKALKAWRKGVEENHPQFIYGSNGCANKKTFALTPKHSTARAKKSLLLFEYLLNYSNEKDGNTWQTWAKNLTQDGQRVRQYGAQPIVGYMRGLLPGTVSLNLAEYICLASGVKWWGHAVVPGGHDKSWIRRRFMVRFSEYYFDTAFRLLPEKRRLKEVAVSGSKRIFWQQFVYERNKKGFRDVTVHLINLPKGDYICQRYKVPPVRKNVKIKVQGGNLTAVYAMLPNPKPHAVKLKVSGNTAILPQLDDAAIILFRFKK
jgi:hypothetical protein